MDDKNTTIKVIHKELLEMVKDFHRFCEETGLRYYIIGGTLLGAIRHKGFIPWDDDMDIAMPRKDFEKFLAFYPQKKYKIITYRSGRDYKYYLPKLYNEEYIIKEKTGNITNLFIDIFPIDGMPDNFLKRKIHIFRILYHRMKVSFFYNDTIDMEKQRKAYEKAMIMVAKAVPFKKIIDPIREKDIIDKLLNKNSMDESHFSGTIMGAYRVREIVETKLFGTPTKYVFEDITLYGPEYYDEYLRHIYSDNYMQLPPLEKRISHTSELKKKG